jgi:hypothetical protein
MNVLPHKSATTIENAIAIDCFELFTEEFGLSISFFEPYGDKKISSQ